MKQIFFAAIGLFLTISVSAQYDIKAKELLDKVSEKTSSYSSISAKFSYTLQNKQDGVEDTFDGELKLKGNKYNLQLMGAVLIFDGKTLYNYLPDAEEVTISEPSNEEENSINPADLFTIYETGFKYKYMNDFTEAGKSKALIDLYPENAGEEKFHTVQLIIDKTTLSISKVSYLGKDGINYIISVTEMEGNKNLTEAMFRFDPDAYDDIDVIDMRD